MLYKLTESNKEYLKTNPEFTKKWIDGLRSGKYTQIQDRMCDEDVPNSACCLHVMEIECNGAKWEDGIDKSLPAADVRLELFNNAYPDRDKEPPQEALRGDTNRGPAGWNDELGFTFEQIATLLETGEVEY